MPLKLSLRPGERFVVNGAVVQNGERRGALILQNKASVLREKDIMQPDEADSPARRIYYPIMLLYLDQGDQDEAYAEFAVRLAEFTSAVRHAEILAECVAVSRDVMAGEYYKALMRCRRLTAWEDDLIGAWMSVQAYQRAATRAESPRDIEYRALGVVTAALVRAREEGRTNLGALARAIHDNRRLWSVFATDCSDPQNALPMPVRARIISISLFVDRHSSAVLREGAELDPLIDINRALMEGLAGR